MSSVVEKLRRGPDAVDTVIVVCSECKRASCWQGYSYCESAKWCGTQTLPVSRLLELDLESPRYWEPEQQEGRR